MELWFSDLCLKDFEVTCTFSMGSVFWGPKSPYGWWRHFPSPMTNFHHCRSAPYCMDLPDALRLLPPEVWRSMLETSKGLAGFPQILHSFSSPSSGLSPAPVGLFRQPRTRQKKGVVTDSKSWLFFCSNLQETARWKNVPLIMTPLCFLKASFWTFKPPQVSSPLFFFPLFFFPLFKLI